MADHSIRVVTLLTALDPSEVADVAARAMFDSFNLSIEQTGGFE